MNITKFIYYFFNLTFFILKSDYFIFSDKDIKAISSSVRISELKSGLVEF